MSRSTVQAVLFSLGLALSLPVWSADPVPPTVESKDTMATLLTRYLNQSVMIRLGYGEPLSGTVKSVGDELLHLGTLRGMEYYDAVIRLEDIEAVVIRARSQ